jgi:cytochrome P450
MEDVELGRKIIRKGDKAYLSYPAANRDPEVFEDPDVFDINRKNARLHLSFGIGPHVCIGAALERMQLNILLKEWLTRVPSFELVASRNGSRVFSSTRSWRSIFELEEALRKQSCLSHFS